MLGLTLSGCIVTPDRYGTREVVRYNQPYPVYRDRVYSQTQRVYVPYNVRQRETVYINQRGYWRADNRRPDNGNWKNRWDNDNRDNDNRRNGWSRGGRDRDNDDSH